jgi:hypothetical protein
MLMNTDVIHDFGNHPDWNESFYFNFYDKKNDVCAFMRIGLKPNKNEKSLFCFFMMPDGSLIGVKDQQSCDNPTLNAKGLNFKKLISEKKWKLTFSGMLSKVKKGIKTQERVSFDLDFESLNPVFDYRNCISGLKEEISQSVASEHLEQFGKAAGYLVVGDRGYHITGLGERGHSWGVRDWNAPKMWIWLTCQFSEKCALNVTKLVVDRGEVDAGFFYTDGKNLPLVKADIDTIYNEEGAPISLKILLKDKDCNQYHVQAEVIKRTILPFEGNDGKALSFLHEPLAKFTYKDMTGYGIAEYLIRKF